RVESGVGVFSGIPAPGHAGAEAQLVAALQVRLVEEDGDLALGNPGDLNGVVAGVEGIAAVALCPVDRLEQGHRRGGGGLPSALSEDAAGDGPQSVHRVAAEATAVPLHCDRQAVARGAFLHVRAVYAAVRAILVEFPQPKVAGLVEVEQGLDLLALF